MSSRVATRTPQAIDGHWQEAGAASVVDALLADPGFLFEVQSGRLEEGHSFDAAATCPSCGAGIGLSFEGGTDGWLVDPDGLRKLSWKSLTPNRTTPMQTHTILGAQFWLAAIFRGPDGWQWLRRFLVAVNVITHADAVLDVLCVPAAATRPSAVGSGLLLIRTHRQLIGLAVQPIAVQSQETAGSPRLRASRSLVKRRASRLGLDSAFCVIAGNPEMFNKPESIPWARALAVLRETEPESRRGQAALFGKRTPGVSHLADDDESVVVPPVLMNAFDPKNGKADRRWAEVRCLQYQNAFYGYLDNLITGGPVKSHAVCTDCGFAWDMRHTFMRQRGRDVRLRLGSASGPALLAHTTTSTPARTARQDGEDARLLDLFADLTSDPELAQAVLREVGVDVGEVHWTLCWPRLRTKVSGADSVPCTTPDILVGGSERLLSIEAKRPDKMGKPGRAELRELLVRACNALELQREPLPAVLFLTGSWVDPESLADMLAAELATWGGSVPHWSEPKKKAPVWKAADCKELGIDRDSLGRVIRTCTWRQLAHATSKMANRLTGDVQTNAWRASAGESARGFGASLP